MEGTGGKTTYHGPGQKIIYPIISLSYFNYDIKIFVYKLESFIINLLKHYNIDSYRIHNQRGVWVNILGNHYKIAAIGIRVRKWVAYHGISININNDLTKYRNIVACGLKYKQTSIEALGVDVSGEDFLNRFNLLIPSEFKKVINNI
ncbi:MAG TPA: lipoyl(octanoyl) transferase LipB [Candidatus Megaira endosymbiont of Hartmannula sinica]|nr:lipoyl(octanoyl) transferase LipB [Candidatus Megaera endosymbiont of Hartmannula sinica]